MGYSPGGSGGGALAIVQYAPSIYAANGPSSSDTMTAVDDINLTISFIAPASGNVLVRLTGAAYIAAATRGYWGLLDHTSHTQVGFSDLAGVGNATDAYFAGSTCAFEITGLTPDNTYQYDWAYCINSGGTAIYLPVQGATDAPSSLNGAAAVMEVWTI